MPEIRKRSFRTHLPIICLILALPAQAGEWAFDANAGGSVGIEFTDNVSSSSNANDRNILTFSPHASLHGESARIKADIDASVQLNDLGGGQSSNPRLQADGEVELLEDFFFVEASSRITSNALNPFQNSGSDLSTTNSNRTDTISYDISPYLVWRFGDFADSELRYTFNDQSDTENQTNQSSSNEVSLNLTSGQYFGPFSWGLSYSKEDIDYEETEDAEFEAVNLNLGYQLNRQWQLTGSVGEDTNEIPDANSKTGGGKWTVGTRWTPNVRTSVQVSTGESFFGSTQSLDASYRRKRSTFTATYSKGVSNARSLLREQQVFVLVDEFGNPIINPLTGFPFLVALDVATLNEGNFVDERFNVGYAWSGKRSGLSLNLGQSRQSGLDAAAVDGTLKNIGLNYNRELSRHVSGNLGLYWSETDATMGTDAEIWRYLLGLSRQLGEGTSVSLRYSLVDRESDTSGDSSKENRVALTFSFDL